MILFIYFVIAAMLVIVIGMMVGIRSFEQNVSHKAHSEPKDHVTSKPE